MKSNWLTLTVLLVGCISLLEQVGVSRESKPASTAPEAAIGPTKDEAISEANEPTPEITFEKMTHNLGQIGSGTKHLREFKFTNRGSGLLKIAKVDVTCGCTVPELPKKEYSPGESGAVKVRYHSGNRPGWVTRRLFVSSNDKRNPRAELAIKAEIVVKVDHDPKRLKLLLDKENAGCGEITLISLDGKPFTIVDFKSTADCITVDVNSSVQATKFVLKPKVVGIEKLQKGLNGRIEIGLTHPECDTITIPFTALPEFEIRPSSIIVLNAEPQQPRVRKAWVISNFNEDFEVESASSEKGIIKILGREKIDNRYKFELEITPPAIEAKRKTFTDVFHVNIKGGKKLEIPCRGVYASK